MPIEELMGERFPLLDGFTDEDVNSPKPELEAAFKRFAEPVGGYRVAKEGVSFPEPLGDVLAAFRWAVAAGDELRIEPGGGLGGGSAGGNLPAREALRVRLSTTLSCRVRPSVIRPALRAASTGRDAGRDDTPPHGVPFLGGAGVGHQQVLLGWRRAVPMCVSSARRPGLVAENRGRHERVRRPCVPPPRHPPNRCRPRPFIVSPV